MTPSVLRIVDCSDTAGSGRVQLMFQRDGRIRTVQISDYRSPFTENFRGAMVSGYRAPDASANARLIDRAVMYGQELGNALLGDDHELYDIIDQIEEIGYHHVDVEIVSADSKFFDDFWELLILPESAFVLSAVCRSFVRTHCNDLRAVEARSWNLRGPDAPDPMGLQPAEDGAVKPMVVTHLLAPGIQSIRNLSWACQTLQMEGAIDHVLFADGSVGDVRAHWQAVETHALHYTGPLRMTADAVEVCVADSSGSSDWVPLRDLPEAAAGRPVPDLLCIECTRCVGRFSPQALLARAAADAMAGGFRSVVGLTPPSDPWTSFACFESLYDRLAAGLALGQAVVEARKSLQSHPQNTDWSIEPTVFQRWPLLSHYSAGDARFFIEAAHRVDLSQSRRLQQARSRLFGFMTHCLPPQRMSETDGGAVGLIALSGPGKAICLDGPQGSGKRQAMHDCALYLRLSGATDYGFYFHVEDELYQSDLLAEMIGPVVGCDSSDPAAVCNHLSESDCLIVLDGEFDHRYSSEHIADLAHWCGQMLDAGHRLVTTRKNSEAMPDIAFINARIPSPDALEQRALLAQSLRSHPGASPTPAACGDADGDPFDGLASLNGNRWLIQKYAELIRKQDCASVADAMASDLTAAGGNNLKTRFFKWRWDTLNAAQRIFASLCAETSEVVLETLSTVDSLGEAFEPASILGGVPEPGTLASIIDALEANGMLVRLGYGRVLDPDAVRFLRDTGVACSAEHELAFSQCLCEGMGVLSRHLLANPSPAISRHLLANRRHWVPHWERLWFAGDYARFMATRTAFRKLLAQANLQAEMSAWSRNLLERSELPLTDQEQQIAFLALAVEALEVPGAIADRQIEAAADYWKTWWDAESATAELATCISAFRFLDRCLGAQQDWQARQRLCDQAAHRFRDAGAWMHYIGARNAGAQSASELGQQDTAAALEDDLLTTVPYDQAPPGLKAQQVQQILGARLTRRDAESAQRLLDLAEKEELSLRPEALEFAKAELNVIRKNYSDALRSYAKVWSNGLIAGHEGRVLALRDQMIEVESKLDGDVVDSIYAEELAAEIPRPTDVRDHALRGGEDPLTAVRR